MNEVKEYSKKTFDLIKHIAKNGGRMPENLPTPDKSLKEIEKEQNIELIDVKNK